MVFKKIGPIFLALFMLQQHALALSEPYEQAEIIMNAQQIQKYEGPDVYLDGKKLTFPVDPFIIDGTTLVPMRAIFEEQDAKLAWDGTTRTITVTKEGIHLTYQVGETTANKNGEQLALSIPGQIVDGNTMVPLRFISEALGNLVKWHEYSRTVTISSAKSYETSIEFGVNLRAAPDSTPGTDIYRMLPKGEKLHVIREIDSSWLEVQTQDNTIGFVSAKPKYTDHASQVLAAMQADKLIAYGKQFLGAPYEFGASSDQINTFDCSSFVRHLYQEILDIDLPRVSYDQAKVGQEISKDELRKGDLLFFTARGLDIGHVGIYIGDNQILQTYSEELGVHITDFEGQWEKRFVTAKRIY
jgi:cell wall-associated NlpC family hydrolase